LACVRSTRPAAERLTVYLGSPLWHSRCSQSRSACLRVLVLVRVSPAVRNGQRCMWCSSSSVGPAFTAAPPHAQYNCRVAPEGAHFATLCWGGGRSSKGRGACCMLLPCAPDAPRGGTLMRAVGRRTVGRRMPIVGAFSRWALVGALSRSAPTAPTPLPASQ